jgi:hypothetical protein
MEDNGPDRTGLPVTPRLAFADQIPRRGGQPRSRGHATDNRTQQRRRKGQDSITAAVNAASGSTFH